MGFEPTLPCGKGGLSPPCLPIPPPGPAVWTLAVAVGTVTADHHVEATLGRPTSRNWRLIARLVTAAHAHHSEMNAP